MTHVEMQETINALPRDHSPMPYSVCLLDKNGNRISHHYVRASSVARAELTAKRVARFVFCDRAAHRASARPWMWTPTEGDAT